SLAAAAHSAAHTLRNRDDSAAVTRSWTQRCHRQSDKAIDKERLRLTCGLFVNVPLETPQYHQSVPLTQSRRIGGTSRGMKKSGPSIIRPKLRRGSDSSFIPQRHQYLRATIGSTLAARRAATRHAIMTTKMSSRDMPANVNGSVGVTPKS